jgi:glycosyltransferase involved in cell wall biosynthesis
VRILLVTHFYPSHGGGVERVAEQLARQMQALGHGVVWAAGDLDLPPGADVATALPMHGLNTIEELTGFPYPLWSPGSLRRLARAVRAADAVHVHDAIYMGSLVAAWLAGRAGKPLIVTQHIGTVPLPRWLQPALALANRLGAHAVLRRARGVAFISPAVQKYFEAITGPSVRHRHVPNGVDCGIFHPGAEPRAALKAALGLDPGRPVLVFVGRFVPKKRLHLLRRMAESAPLHWQWLVVGQGPEDPRAWGLSQVRVLDAMPHAALAEHYRAADLLVLPSHGEGFPLVVQEAMACGLPPAITAEVAAGGALPRELWVRLPDDPADFAQAGVVALRAALEAPPPIADAQRRACAALAASAWSWEQAAGAHLSWILESAP